MAVSIRNLQPEDMFAADRVLMAAFGSTESFRFTIDREYTLQPDCYWGAWEGGALAGTIAAIRYGHIAYIGMMGVEPACQRRGVAAALVEYAIAELTRAGCDTLLLDSTVAGEPLYRRFGFVHETTTLELRRAGSENAPQGQDGADLIRESDMEDVIALDEALFGANRRKVFQRLLAEPGGKGWVVREAGQLRGYAIAQQKILGPWVAKSTEAAQLLMQAFLAERGANDLRLFLPVENEAALPLLHEAGFLLHSRVPHLRRGLPRPLSGRSVTWGLASFALG